MMRLIDADAFRRELDNHWPFTRGEQSKHGMADVAKSVVLVVLNKMPTIEERKTGRWIDAVLPNDNGGLPVQVCDQCNTFFPLAYTGGGHRFCPSCGAKMEVEHE